MQIVEVSKEKKLNKAKTVEELAPEDSSAYDKYLES